jgi:hypothetical protein
MAGLFFDTSALAKLYHAEAGSAMVEGLVLRSGSVIFISRLGVVEAGSVFAMKARSCVIILKSVQDDTFYPGPKRQTFQCFGICR